MRPSTKQANPASLIAAGDSCTFELLDVDALQDPGNGRIVHLYALTLRCHACTQVFTATEGQGFASMSGARVLRCPAGCGQQILRAPALRRWRPQALTASPALPGEAAAQVA